MTKSQRARLLACMRNLMAQGWTEEALIVGTAAQIIGGDKTAHLLAQRVYDQTFKITEPN